METQKVRGSLSPKTGRIRMMPICFVRAIVGLTVLDRSSGRYWQIGSYLYSLVCIVGFGFLTKLSLMNLSHFCLTKSLDAGLVMVRVLLYGHLCITICTIVCAWFRTKPMRDIVSLHDRCDDALERIGVPRDYPKIYVRQYIMLAIHVSLAITFAAINCKWLILKDTPLEIAIALIITIEYPTVVINVVDITFLYWVRCVGIKFAQLNRQLRNMLTTSLDSPQHQRVVAMLNVRNANIPATGVVTSTQTASSRQTKEDFALMKAAKQIHLDLTKVGRKTSDAFGIHLLLSMTSSFTLVTSLLYYGYVIFWKPMEPDQYEREMVTLGFWIVLFAFKILVVSHVCALTSIEAANTGDIICELYEPSTSCEFRAEIRQFTLQMIQNPLTFTAHGFFDLDHTFVHATIASITTYLVILIQVGDVSEENAAQNDTFVSNDTGAMNLSIGTTIGTTSITRFTNFNVNI